MTQPSIIIILLFCNYFYKDSLATVSPPVHFLKPGDIYKNDKSGLEIFCHNANAKYLINMWKSLTIHLNTSIDNFDLYDGRIPQEVVEKHYDNQRSWGFNLFTAKKNVKLKVNPFEDLCIGVYVHPSNLHEYTLSMTPESIDTIQVALTVLGALLYWNARELSGNTLFHYLCGITLGLTTSIMILVYFTSKFLLRGKLMYLMVATGWTMSFYLFQMIWDNAQLIAVRYREMIMWYILSVSGISFVICYWFGPVTNPRTKKVMQWSLQIAGLCAMYYSSYFREASFFCCAINVLFYNFFGLFRKGWNYWRNMFPEPKKLLTEDQYRKEGIKETKKALTELKEYCSSPECNPWKTVLRLNDPIRFAKFMEGESHLSDEETREHDAEITRITEESEYTDDEDDF